MIKQSEFEGGDFRCQFSCELDPRINKGYTVEFTKDDFKALSSAGESSGISLEKFAANKALNNKSS